MDYDMDYYKAEMMYERSLDQTWEVCVWPSISDISIAFFLCNIIFRLTSQLFDIPRSLQHFSSIASGIALLYYTLQLDFLKSFYYMLGFTFIEYCLLLTLSFVNLKNFGHILTPFCLATLLIGEILDTEQTWHRIRGTQMVASLKIVSIAYDLDRERIQNIPNFLQFWGYIFCPGNVVFGPWCAYNDYIHIFNRRRVSIKWVFQAALNAFLAVGFLTLSNCIVPDFVPDFDLKWFIAYKGALSYRCSHYFVCFLSHCTMLLAGFESKRNSRSKHNQILGYSITKPWVIEMPRSLVDVVVYWNLSMHYWLKTYIFTYLKPRGIFKAVILTYIVSSLLHGLNIQLAAVLLTLGFATYAEYSLRKKLADIYNACILAHPCVNCTHRYNSYNPWVISFNFGFGLLAVFHLAYLGVVIGGTHDQSDMNASLDHIQSCWRPLDYATHWLIFILMCFNGIV